MTRTYWLSFTDDARPAGSRLLGVCVGDVLTEEAEAQRPRLLPQSQPGAEWLAAAMRKAWDNGCNPGGSVASYNITGHHEADIAPRHVLLSKDDLLALGLVDPS
jgi:hypothetical protein